MVRVCYVATTADHEDTTMAAVKELGFRGEIGMGLYHDEGSARLTIEPFMCHREGDLFEQKYPKFLRYLRQRGSTESRGLGVRGEHIDGPPLEVSHRALISTTGVRFGQLTIAAERDCAFDFTHETMALREKCQVLVAEDLREFGEGSEEARLGLAILRALISVCENTLKAFPSYRLLATGELERIPYDHSTKSDWVERLLGKADAAANALRSAVQVTSTPQDDSESESVEQLHAGCMRDIDFEHGIHSSVNSAFKGVANFISGVFSRAETREHVVKDDTWKSKKGDDSDGHSVWGGSGHLGGL